ncbi:MAG: tyrosine-type recombinase/integrase, partial [Pseudomonadota bacterium]
NAWASETNKNRDTTVFKAPLSRVEMAFHVEKYKAYREDQDPKLAGKASWKNRRYALDALGKYLAGTRVAETTHEHLKVMWHTLTYDQQKLRHAEFRRFFNYLMGEGLCPQLEYNPFTTSDDKPRLYVTGQPEKRRLRLDRDSFWAIYDAAGDYPALQIAMGISLLTFMREGDICSLKWSDNIEGELLRRVIGKSLQQRGSASAARLQWDVGNYDYLKKLINRAREIHLQHRRSCPFVIMHKPQQRRTGKTKEHAYQVTPRRLATMFAEAREATGLYEHIDEDRTPPTFHEIRSLAAKLAKDAGYSDRQIQIAMAHENVATTRSYQDEHELPFADAGVALTADVLGREF